MKFKLLLSTAFLFGLVWSTDAQDIESHGVTFPAKMKINDQVVKYNGSGLREKYFFDLYVSALYLPEQTKDAQKIIDMDKESCIRIKLVSDKVTRDKFVETVKEETYCGGAVGPNWNPTIAPALEMEYAFSSL